MKRRMGKAEVEDALEQLNTLTQEEKLMAVARIIEADHHKKTVLDDLRRPSLPNIIINRCG